MSENNGFHPVASIFPMMGDDQLKELARDIKENGQREPIWLFRSKIIDGRNRWRACAMACVEPVYREWDGKEKDLLAFVVSMNLHRRHLNESQRGAVAARIVNLEPGDNQHSEVRSIDRTSNKTMNDMPAVSRKTAGELMNVGEATIGRAKRVLTHGVPELVDAVDRGEVSVSAAALVSEHKPEVQTELVAAGPNAVVREAHRLATSTSDRKTDARHGIRTARVTMIGDLIHELLELTRRPHHRYPYLQIKEKAKELSEAFSKAFG